MRICCSSVLMLSCLAAGSLMLANTGAATGLHYPVVPKGDEEIRFQINASRTAADIDVCLAVLEALPGR